MKTLLFLFVALMAGSQCYAQSANPGTKDKAITATVDTCHVTTDYSLNVIEFSITNRSATDTLRWRTNNEATWSLLFPRQAYHAVKSYAKYIYRWSPYTSTSTYSQLKWN